MMTANRSIKIGGLLAGLCMLPVEGRAELTVAEGWDLFMTDPGGTTFAGQSFEGVPLGTFDFGGTIGTKDVGETDTIVHRLSAALVGGPPTQTAAPINLELVALQLKSVNQFDPDGAGPALTDFYYVTLQSVRGGTASTGNMTITFGPEGNPHGTFDSFLDVFFDIRMGSLTGSIVNSGNVQLPATDSDWSHEAPAGALKIEGVNFMLNGVDIMQDFWGTPEHTGPHGVSPAVPEPEQWAGIAGLALLGFAAGRRYRLGRAAEQQ